MKSETAGLVPIVVHAMYQQLTEDPVVSKEGQLRGIPWGRVQKCPDTKCGSDRHFHIIWQLGESLRRAKIEKWKVVGNPVDHLLRESGADGYADLLVWLMVDLGRIKASDRDCHKGEWWPGWTGYVDLSYSRKQHYEKILSEFNVTRDAEGVEKIKSLFWNASQPARELHDALSKTYAKLEALEQIFISV